MIPPNIVRQSEKSFKLSSITPLLIKLRKIVNVEYECNSCSTKYVKLKNSIFLPPVFILNDEYKIDNPMIICEKCKYKFSDQVISLNELKQKLGEIYEIDKRGFGF